MSKIFCTRLRELRADQSQAEFAGILGVKQQTYARWEQGICEPDYNTLRQISHIFGVSFCWLFSGDNEDTSKLKHPSCMTGNGEKKPPGNKPSSMSEKTAGCLNQCHECSRKDDEIAKKQSQIERMERIIDKLTK